MTFRGFDLKRYLPACLVLVGIAISALAFSADLVGIGSPGIGGSQIMLILTGGVAVLVGILVLPVVQRYVRIWELRLTSASWATLAGIVLFGLVLRIYRIDYQSLWFDEALTLVDSQLPLTEMTERVIYDFAHPPLHHYMLHAWFKLFGFGVLQARLFSAVFGGLSIVMVFLLARYLDGDRTALLSALLLAVSQLGVMYSQEARPYTQLIFLTLLSSYLFIVALREDRSWAWWGFVCSACLVFYTHYHGVLWVFGLLLFAFVYRKRYAFRRTWLIGGAALALVLLAPWLVFAVLRHVRSWQGTLFQQQPYYFAVHWRTFFSTMNGFNNGKWHGLFAFSPPWVFGIGGLLFTLPAFYSLKPLGKRLATDRPERVRQENLAFLAILWILPMVVAIGLGAAIKLRYDARYIIFCTAPYYILAAYGITRLSQPTLRRVAVLSLLIYSVGALRSNYFMPYKENYRDALAHLATEYQEEDCVIFSPWREVPLQWEIYHGDHPGLRVTDPDTVAANQTSCNRVWLVAYQRVDWALEQNKLVEGKLETTHSKTEERQYFWVRVGLYVAKESRSRSGRDTCYGPATPLVLAAWLPGSGAG